MSDPLDGEGEAAQVKDATEMIIGTDVRMGELAALTRDAVDLTERRDLLWSA